MPSHSSLSYSVASLAVVAGLAYSDVRLGEILTVLKLEAAAGMQALASERQTVVTSARIVANHTRSQLAISHGDLLVLRRDLEARLAPLRDRWTTTRDQRRPD